MNGEQLEIGERNAKYSVKVVGQYKGKGDFLSKGTIILKSVN
ncbi:hypothetical protein [Flavobacterium sp.]|nr:hypothetical protein [Flavobacterium sp.]HLP65505.1 hypothetical protein [Flavobacterium sp.]